MPGCSDHRWTQPDLGLQRQLWGHQAIDVTYCHDQARGLQPVDGWGGGPWFREECIENGDCMRFYVLGWEAIYQLTVRGAGSRVGFHHAQDLGTMPYALGIDACADLASGPNATCDDGELAHARASAFFPAFDTVGPIPRRQAVGTEITIRPFERDLDGSDENLTEWDVGLDSAGLPGFLPDRYHVDAGGVSGRHEGTTECALPRVWTDSYVDTPCFRELPLTGSPGGAS